jgi:hypothetical protein
MRQAVLLGTPRDTTAGNIVVGVVSTDNKLHFEVHQMTEAGTAIAEEDWYTVVDEEEDVPRPNWCGPIVRINLKDVDLTPQWLGLAPGGHSLTWHFLTDCVRLALDGNPHNRRVLLVHDPPRVTESGSFYI